MSKELAKSTLGTGGGPTPRSCRHAYRLLRSAARLSEPEVGGLRAWSRGRPRASCKADHDSGEQDVGAVLGDSCRDVATLSDIRAGAVERSQSPAGSDGWPIPDRAAIEPHTEAPRSGRDRQGAERVRRAVPRRHRFPVQSFAHANRSRTSCSRNLADTDVRDDERGDGIVFRPERRDRTASGAPVLADNCISVAVCPELYCARLCCCGSREVTVPWSGLPRSAKHSLLVIVAPPAHRCQKTIDDKVSDLATEVFTGGLVKPEMLSGKDTAQRRFRGGR